MKHNSFLKSERRWSYVKAYMLAIYILHLRETWQKLKGKVLCELSYIYSKLHREIFKMFSSKSLKSQQRWVLLQNFKYNFPMQCLVAPHYVTELCQFELNKGGNAQANERSKIND